MITSNITKTTKFVVLVGWAGRFFCDNLYNANDLKHLYGDRAEIKTLEQYLKWIME